MKKLILLLLIFASCTDQDFIEKKISNDRFLNVRPMIEQCSIVVEGKSWQSYLGSSSPSPLSFAGQSQGTANAGIVTTLQSGSINTKYIQQYEITLYFKNKSTQIIYIYINGTASSLHVNSEKTVVLTGGCLSTDCPENCWGNVFIVTGLSAKPVYNDNKLCTIPIDISMKVKTPHSPTAKTYQFTATFYNEDC